jgi:predicted TIM-barrel fold metal-dependent hydrolase
MDLIDTHQHLILRGQLGYPWSDSIPALAGRDFSPADYAGLTQGLGIVGTVFMETAVEDTEYQAEARLIAGMVGQGGMLGQIASCRPEVDEGFDAWLEECDSLHVVGFRRILHVVPDDVSQSETFRRNLRKIGQKGLPFDLCVLARQHDLAIDLIRACDGQSFVLDHCGNPDIAANAFATWAASLRRIADFPNVVIKLSGITVNARADQVNAQSLQPYVDQVLDCFGPERILWGGDWPVCDLGSGLPGWISLTHQFLAGLSESERSAIGTSTARRIYGVQAA